MKIAIYVNPVQGGWSVTDPETWGGGEETAVGFARALATAGHTVTVYYDGPMHAEKRGECLVSYVDRAVAGQDAARGAFDVAVYFKAPEAAGLRLAPKQYVWTDQERAFDPEPFEAIVACSPYLKRFLGSLQPRMEARLHVVPYGVDVEALEHAAVYGDARRPHQVLHAASPDRGLEHLLAIWPEVREAVPDATLVCTYGWEMFDRFGGDPTLKQRMQALMDGRDEITFKRFSREETHRLYWQSGVFAYYCTGGEQYGISLLKAQFAWCFPVVRPWGALHDTLQSGIRCVDLESFKRGLIAALTSVASPKLDVKVPSWPEVVRQWEELFAAPPPPAFESHLRLTPDTPHFHRDAGWNMAPIVQPMVAGWFDLVKPQKPWIDPELPFPPGPRVAIEAADAVCVGFRLEDDKRTIKAHLAELGVKSGTPVLAFFSTGMWRAGKRHRVIDRPDVERLFSQCPEYRVQPALFDIHQNGILGVMFHYVPSRVGERDTARVLRVSAPRETLSVCYIARNAQRTFPLSLESIASSADQVVVVDTGSSDATPDIVADFQRRHRSIEVVYDAHGTSPRWCYDCQREHDLGELAPGHRVAGFETPRNQSLLLANGDWVLWVDCDEEMLGADQIGKYLRPSVFQGFSIQQHHHSCDPPELRKTDFPVRLFRRVVDPNAPVGMHPDGPDAWPTVGTGLTVRFTGIVHEHPGTAPNYTEGIGPAIILSDVHLAHRGYYTEDQRRRRFSRNWPLMVADRRRYKGRRLGRFLWLRDLSHQLRYVLEMNGGRLTPEAAQLAEEGRKVFREDFIEAMDGYAGDAYEYARICAQALGHGMDVDVIIKARKPELTGPEEVNIQFSGRFDSPEDVLKAIKARSAEMNRWTGPYL